MWKLPLKYECTRVMDPSLTGSYVIRGQATQLRLSFALLLPCQPSMLHAIQAHWRDETKETRE